MPNMGPRQTYKVCGFEQVSGLSIVKGLTIPNKAPDGTTCKPNAVLLQAGAQIIRWRPDGGTPTASIGMLLPTNQLPYYYDGDLNALRFIEVTASAVLNVTYLEDESL